MALTHRQAVLVMLAVTAMWSIAGVVTRHLDSARGFEVTFWRSAFNVLALLLMLGAMRGPRALAAQLRQGGRALWVSGACWAVMYTAFMIALTLTTVANVLVTMSIGPLLTALAARIALGHRLQPRTWLAIAVAGAGIAWMYGHELAQADGRHLLGILVACAVPVAAAINWTLLQHIRGHEEPADMLPAVLIGAAISALVTLPLAWPMQASAHDVGLLGMLGVVQLAVPCLLAVLAARALSAPEISLLGLLEVIFGVAWAWLGAGEVPSPTVLLGGTLVIATLALHEVLALLGQRQAPAARAADPA